MADAPILSTFIFVDRRQTGRGKSLNNRQKLLERIRDSIRQANPKDLGSDAGGGVKGGSTNSSSSKKLSNPVSIAKDALHEPSFHYARSGETEIVLVGNDRWERGDEFPIDDSDGEGSGSGEAGHGPDGEDDFIVNISRSEFYDVYFEDCELPNMQETSEKVTPEAVWKPAGYQKEGNAAQLSVIRSFRNGLGRRRALSLESRLELEELEAELEQLEEVLASNPLNAVANARHKEVLARIEELRTKISAIPFFEKVDLRYRKTERVQVKQADAVLVMVMDISGSMGEDKKTIARRFFALQYAFIERMYPNTDLVFIAHTDDAEEMSEEDFFTTRKSGGTTVSSGLKLAHTVIKRDYDPDQTNIYLSYAGDGDNWEMDNANVTAEFEEAGLLSKLRHAVYVQVGESYAAGYGSGPSLWTVMQTLSNNNPKLKTIKIVEEGEVFDAFKKVYGKKDAK